jgi:hypothetical protein
MDTRLDCRRLYLAGSVAAFTYVAAQVVQKLIRLASDAPLDRLDALDILRASVVWLSFWGIPVAYYALYRHLAGRRPQLALLGLAASILFVVCELGYRTVDLFVVTRRWAATRPDLVGLWDQLVEGWYVALLIAHLVGLAAYACALGRRQPVAAASLGAYGLVTAMRLVAYAFVPLEPICAALYFPTAVASAAAIGATLGRAARGPDTASA